MTSSARRDTRHRMQLDAVRAAPEFHVFKGLAVNLPQAAFRHPALLPFHARLALEAAWFESAGIAAALAALAAARAAAQFVLAEPVAPPAALPAWVRAMAADIAPPAATLAAHFPDAAAKDIALIRRVWPLLGTAESIMETGGDIRLTRDPILGLNGYGCSHRPRPWAITFASSTASSSSARGYVAADRARLRTALAALRGTPPRRAIRARLRAVRSGLTRALALAPGSRIILAASGTDTELLALALTHLSGQDTPILNILVAPEETGRGVPMAARGLHFAVDTARGQNVTFETPIAGFRPDTALANIALRHADGSLRPIETVEAEIGETVAAAIGQGRRVILHALDLSKTGLLAPRPAFLTALRACFGRAFDIVVDACQTRLSPASIAAYLALDATVLITGSKFFTGPPFAGALLLPPAIAARLSGEKTLPAGLDAYFGQDDFFAPCPAAATLPASGNYGLALRWHAARAEMTALYRISPERRAEILRRFATAARRAIAANPALTLLDVPAIARGGQAWERLPGIFTFSIRGPHGRLGPEDARKIYAWLNADLSPWIADPAAGRICHIGQPVGLGGIGALRVSAGARLLSGEPSHRGLSAAARLTRELADLATVFDKIGLILRHWEMLAAANPAPCFRPAPHVLTGATFRLPMA
jgi:hypothetical protein